MKKLVSTCLTLVLVVCGCLVVCGYGKTYTLQEQQAEFKTWSQNFQEKTLAAVAVGQEQAELLAKVDAKKITDADAEAQFKQLEQKFTESQKAFDQPPEIKSLSKEDQQILRDCYKDMHTSLDYMEKLITVGREDEKTPSPHLEQTLSSTQKQLETLVEKIHANIKLVGSKLKVPVN